MEFFKKMGLPMGFGGKKWCELICKLNQANILTSELLLCFVVMNFLPKIDIDYFRCQLLIQRLNDLHFLLKAILLELLLKKSKTNLERQNNVTYTL